MADSDTFEFTYSKGLLSVTTDQGVERGSAQCAGGHNMPHQEHYDFLARSGGASRNKRRSNWSAPHFWSNRSCCCSSLSHVWPYSRRCSPIHGLHPRTRAGSRQPASLRKTPLKILKQTPGCTKRRIRRERRERHELPREPHRRKRSYGSRHQYTVHIAVSDDTGEVYSLEAQRYMEGARDDEESRRLARWPHYAGHAYCRIALGCARHTVRNHRKRAGHYGESPGDVAHRGVRD